jgi:hypothetical protein
MSDSTPKTAKDLQAAVDDIVNQKSQTLMSTIADKLADTAIQARTLALETAITNLRSNVVARDRYKPDQNVVDANGAVIVEGYSQNQALNRKRYQDSVDQLDAAITAGLAGDFELLRKLNYIS